MKRTLRILVNAATALSLALCVATAVLWVRSYHVSDQFQFVDGLGPAPVVVRETYALADHGLLQVRRSQTWIPGLGADEIAAWDRIRAKGVAGFRWHREPLPPPLPSGPSFAAQGSRYQKPAPWASSPLTEDWRFVLFPCWTLCVVTAVLPTARAYRALRRARTRTSGLCPACGYDLRATPGRCPECGRGTANAAAAARIPPRPLLGNRRPESGGN